jgi:L-lactate dehydrogenase complex protein LldF
LWSWAARRPRLYHLGTRIATRALRLLGGGRGSVSRLPLAGGWTAGRDLPLPTGSTFQQAWKRRRTGRSS